MLIGTISAINQIHHLPTSIFILVVLYLRFQQHLLGAYLNLETRCWILIVAQAPHWWNLKG
ncbi:MAG: hypothetical protein A2Z94_06400 [Gallionellales bacterium GWA2_55_18]|nr:MAG: hypothetical protein A2Z94_06400 [Gallionellales bacterium GWA2_55_18]